MNVAKKAWGALLADVLAGGRPFRSRNTGTRMNTKEFQESCGEGYDHKEGQRLTGRGRQWLAGQHYAGSALGSSPSEYKSKFF